MTETSTAPAPLTEAESLLLKHLMKLKEQADINVAEYVTYVLSTRQLSVKDWGIDSSDFRTINPLPKDPA